MTGAGVGNGIGTTAYADLIGDPYSTPPITNAADINGPLLYNPGAFAAPTGLTFGDAGRNILNVPTTMELRHGSVQEFLRDGESELRVPGRSI